MISSFNPTDNCNLREISGRIECGWPNITKEQCLERDCCYDHNAIYPTKNCFVKPHLGRYILMESEFPKSTIYFGQRNNKCCFPCLIFRSGYLYSYDSIFKTCLVKMSTSCFVILCPGYSTKSLKCFPFVRTGSRKYKFQAMELRKAEIYQSVRLTNHI